MKKTDSNYESFDDLNKKVPEQFDNQSTQKTDYSYGETSEKLPPWAVRIDPPQLKVAIWEWSRTTWQWVWQSSITCGFVPKIIMIEAVYADSADGWVSIGQATSTTDETCRYFFGATGANYFGASYDTWRIIYVRKASWTSTKASIYSIDSSWFTLDWTTVGVDCNFQWKAIW